MALVKPYPGHQRQSFRQTIMIALVATAVGATTTATVIQSLVKPMTDSDVSLASTPTSVSNASASQAIMADDQPTVPSPTTTAQSVHRDEDIPQPTTAAAPQPTIDKMLAPSGAVTDSGVAATSKNMERQTTAHIAHTARKHKQAAIRPRKKYWPRFANIFPPFSRQHHSFRYRSNFRPL
jgi:hypothetical protein